jgi:hypothetical protein
MPLDPRHQAEDRSYSRAVRVGLLLSLIVHALLFLSFRSDVSLPESPYAAAGERMADARAAPGGGIEAVQLRPPSPQVVPPEPEPVPDPEPEEEEVPEPEVVLEEVPVVALVDAGLLVGSPGPTEGPGLEDGQGQGDGGTEAEGRFRVVPPRPRGLTLPPSDRPGEVRGKEIEVWVYVSAAGQVVPDSTRLHPSTGDRRFDRRLLDHAAGWVFEAARRDGRAVAEWFRYTLIM